MTVITPGSYRAKLVDYGIKMTKSQDPAPMAQAVFEIQTEGTPRLYWQGTFGGEALKHTGKALFVMGLQSAADIDSVADGVEGGALDTSREYNVVVENETDENNKPRSKVRWVNATGGIQGTVKKEEFARVSAQRNLRGLLKSVQEQEKIKVIPREQTKPDIPF